MRTEFERYLDSILDSGTRLVDFKSETKRILDQDHIHNLWKDSLEDHMTIYKVSDIESFVREHFIDPTTKQVKINLLWIIIGLYDFFDYYGFSEVSDFLLLLDRDDLDNGRLTDDQFDMVFSTFVEILKNLNSSYILVKYVESHHQHLYIEGLDKFFVKE